MSSSPTFSVIMATFNRLDYLRVAVASVFAQTFQDWEFIIIDDGSDDLTRSYLRELKDPRLLVEFHGHTGNPAVIRNLGIVRAQGQYLAFLDSDDAWMPEKLQRQLELMTSCPGRRWSYTGVRRINADGQTIEESVFSKRHAYDGSITKQLLRFEAVVAMPSVVADTAMVKELGGFDEQLVLAEDYELWLRISLLSEVCVEPTPLCSVRNHDEHITQNRPLYLENKIRMFQKMRHLMPTRALRSIAHSQWADHVLSRAVVAAKKRDWKCLSRTLKTAISGRAFRPKGWLRVAASVALPRRK